MPAEFEVKYTPPVNVPDYFDVRLNRAAMFDLIVTVKAAVDLLDNLPESAAELLSGLEAEYNGDLPTGVNLDGDTLTA